jgi:hypothetical protein
VTFGLPPHLYVCIRGSQVLHVGPPTRHIGLSVLPPPVPAEPLVVGTPADDDVPVRPSNRLPLRRPVER